MLILKNLYHSFTDTTFELIFRTSLDGAILFSNRSFLLHFGFSNYRQAKRTNISVLFEFSDTYAIFLQRIIDEKRITSETLRFRRQDGSVVTALVNCSLQTDIDSAPVLNWAMLDITHQVESEQKLQHKNDELAKVNHQMEKFLYSTSHDLRSPLTTILGLVNLMRLETKDDAVLDYILKVESSTLRLDKIIKDIMSFSRTAYQRATSVKIDFEALIWKALSEHRPDPTLRKMAFEVNIDNKFPFSNDLGRIEIIIDNIVRNCITFYDKNKERPSILINVSVEKTQAQLEFIDNGIGIAKQHLDHIFNMFYKASHHSKGAGLGLFIVKETVGKLQGHVMVESEIGFGTVMRITIPNDHKSKLTSRKVELQSSGH